MKVNIYNIEVVKSFSSNTEKKLMIAPQNKFVNIEEIIKRFPFLSIFYRQKCENPNRDNLAASSNLNVRTFLQKISELTSLEGQHDHIVLQETSNLYSSIQINIEIFENVNDVDVLKNVSYIKDEEFDLIVDPSDEIINFFKKFTVSILPCNGWDEFERSMTRTIDFFRNSDNNEKTQTVSNFLRGGSFEFNNQFEYNQYSAPIVGCLLNNRRPHVTITQGSSICTFYHPEDDSPKFDSEKTVKRGRPRKEDKGV